MKQPFPNNIINEAVCHAQDEYPKESCGFIMKDKYMPVKNIADDPVNDFKIDTVEFIKNRNEIEAIIHSHADYPHISKADMISQQKSGYPWGVVLLQNNSLYQVAFWGNDILYDLIGRPFIHGIFDCYALVRDYWRSKGHDVIDFPRDNLWWVKEPSMLDEHCCEAGFDNIDISELKIGDVITMKVLANVTNHQGIYIGDGLMMHHLYNRLSRKEPMNRWSKHITGFFRYKYA